MSKKYIDELCRIYGKRDIKQLAYLAYVYHFSELSPQNSSEKGLFTDFINEYIKLKVEASGWPKDGMQESEKDEYVKLYKETQRYKYRP